MRSRRECFRLPEGVAYLDGNSLGPPLASTASQLDRRVDEWADSLIGGWNRNGWMVEPEVIGNRLATLIGAAPGTVTVGDTLSIRFYQALAAALAIQDRQARKPTRRRVLTDSGNFPSDLYIAKSLLTTLGDGYELVVVEPESVTDALDETVAVLMLTEVDYRSARKHDMHALTTAAHACGALTLWDLAHSAGAFPVALEETNADFAVGCTYKYLNGGPGAPAFIHVAQHLDLTSVPRIIAGWLGHADPFAFAPDYRPAPGIEGFRIGTPPVLAMRALDTALDIFDTVALLELAERSAQLSERLIEGVRTHCPSLTLASPADAAARGSHVSFSCEVAYPVMQSLINDFKVIGDVRAPDLLRFGIAPLYVEETDIDRCVQALAEIVKRRLWDRSEYLERQLVT